jgi:hypothetical protein
MRHTLNNVHGSMSLRPFQSHFEDHLWAIRKTKDSGASHDHLCQVLIEFAIKSFRVDPADVKLEKAIKGTKVRGSIDAPHEDIVCEFRRDLKLERDKGREELEGYLRSLGDKQVFFGVLTDGLTFEVYRLQDDMLTKIDEFNLESLWVDDALVWFDVLWSLQFNLGDY